MYPKNAASPEPIAIGPVIQISDGAVQTSGCTVRIKPIGVAEGDGGGTTAYSTDGIVLYTPTQAETNYTSFILIAKKTGCIPASVTVITTSSATPGTVLLAPVTHTSATIPTVTTTTTATNVTTVNGLAANVITSTSIATGAFTGAKFASDVTIASVTGAVGSVTGNVGGNVTGSVGSVVGAVGSVTGAVGSVTGLTPATVHSDLDDIQSRLPAALVSGRMDSYTGAMATNVITAAGLAADAVTEIQVGLALEATSQQIKTQATIAAQKPEII